MEVSIEVNKITNCAIYSTVFFLQVEVLMMCWYVRLPLIEKITKDVDLMCISFSVKHSQIFWESLTSLSNMPETIFIMCTYLFNPQLMVKK